MSWQWVKASKDGIYTWISHQYDKVTRIRWHRKTCSGAAAWKFESKHMTLTWLWLRRRKQCVANKIPNTFYPASDFGYLCTIYCIILCVLSAWFVPPVLWMHSKRPVLISLGTNSATLWVCLCLCFGKLTKDQVFKNDFHLETLETGKHGHFETYNLGWKPQRYCCRRRENRKKQNKTKKMTTVGEDEQLDVSSQSFWHNYSIFYV